MKRPLLIILTAILSTQCFSQILFEKGYFIANNDQKTECLIKNIDWKNNPTNIQYRLSENAKQLQLTIADVKEFGIYDYSKYVRSTVNIDRSSEDIDDLSQNRNPDFKEETLFLKVLVEGASNLYQYEDGNLYRYFYSIQNSNNIKQLVFKSYRLPGNLIRENNGFKQELLNVFDCEHIKTKAIEKLSYTKVDLVHIFIKYNACHNSEIVNYDENQRRDVLSLALRFGLNSSSYSMKNTMSSSRAIDFDNQLGLRVGLEAQLLLPFNKDKWALIVEPTYQYFKSEKVGLSTSDINVDYTSIELPIGVRYYFFLNENSKLFINGSYILDITKNSKISYETGTVLDIKNSSNLGFGLGYKQNNKYSLELRYHTSRNLLKYYQAYHSHYDTLSVILGYSLF
ncbi:porin family protein [Winogradskyella wichelsiae]|uniref:outer membrane beta-barrel protein n=1 Tax=Winogradskyella wichelsiae TaxID=2697007 RepID=UPI0015CCAA01|nr:outer membrane beta-barrel protein [Winogradskyella wichelsiae]